MTDYTKLVKALRCRDAEFGYYRKCKYYGEASDNRCVLCDSDRLAKDAAAAIEELQDVLKEADKKQEYQHDCICELAAENEELKAENEALQAELEKKRTADCFGCKCEKIEPKRGKWEKEETGKGIFKQIIYKCSICGRYLDFDGVNAGRGDANYCPCCGAKMNGEQNVE